MPSLSKPIRLSAHARQQLPFRGATENEVLQTIEAGTWQAAELGRLECHRDFPFDSDWNGKHYSTKQIRPIFVDEPTEVVVVTVYVYYF